MMLWIVNLGLGGSEAVETVWSKQADVSSVWTTQPDTTTTWTIS